MNRRKKLFHEFLSLFLILAVVGGTFYYSSKKMEAATNVFTQNIWSGGATSNNAVHPTNQSGWNQYSTSTDISAGADISLLSSSASTTDSSFSTGLVGLWRMNETSGASAIADSAGTSTGTIFGATAGSSGKLNNALNFDGTDDYVNLGTSPTLDVQNNEFSVGAWIKIPQTGLIDKPIFSNASQSNGLRGFALVINRRFGISPNANIDLQKRGIADQNIAYTFAPDTWYYIVVTQHFSGGAPSEVKFYVNGSYLGNYVNTAAYYGSTGDPKHIGQNIAGDNEFYKGLIDELSIHNRALSAGEIVDYYNNGAGREIIAVGTNFSTTVSGTGTGASVQLATDVGTGADGAANMTSSVCSGVGISGTAPNCSIVGATYNYTTFNIDSGVVATVTGTSALIIKATGNVTIAGTLSLNGMNALVSDPGADGGAGGDAGGGFISGICFTGSGAGGGSCGSGVGGGGGFGGKGGSGTNNWGTGGPIYNTLNAGGSGGGGPGGGGGGGSLKIISAGTISNTGTIRANGGGGYSGSGVGGGGGSGGRITLITPFSITNSGSIIANGGAGGVSAAVGGGGGGGRITLIDNDGVITGGTITANGGTGWSNGTANPVAYEIFPDFGTGADGAYSCTSGTCSLAGATYNYTTFNISSGATVNITGTTALIIKATGNVTIAGTLSLNGGDGTATTGGAGGAGGSIGGYGTPGVGGGSGGGVCTPYQFGGSHGSGGGFGGGGGQNMSNGAGGSIYNTLNTGGSGGGSGTCPADGNGGGGGGGGSLKIISAGTISNTGTIRANGGWGILRGAGGSGGRITLITPFTIINSGSITTNGGSNISGYAGVGGGGGGRITLIDNDGVISGGTITASGGVGGGSGGDNGTANPVAYEIFPLNYLSSGTFESATIDLQQKVNFSTLTFNATTTNAQTSCTQTTGAGCAVKIQIAAGNSTSSWTYVGPDGTSGTYFTVSGENIPSSLNSNRYLKYKTYLATINTDYTPNFNDITFNYSQFSASAELTSSKYDTADNFNLLTKINWTESATSTTETIKFQIRTASSSAGLDSAVWCGYEDCSGTSYFGDNANEKNNSVASGHPIRNNNDDRWFQYKLILSSGGAITPVVDDVAITYVVNAPPEFDSAFGTNGVSVSQIADSSNANLGKVLIIYSVRDPDALSGTINPGYVTPSFEYRLNSAAAWTAINSANLNSNSLNNKVVSEINYTSTSTIVTATTTSALWDAVSQLGSNIYSTTTQIRVTINDNEAANSVASSTSAVFTLETKPPVASIAIDSSGSNDVITFNFSDDSNIEYRLANSSLTNESYTTVNATSTTASTTWTLAGSPSYETVYFNVRDIYGNVASSSDTAPAIGSQNYAGINIKDISNITTGDWKEFISWYPYLNATNASFSSYQIFRSVSNNANYGGSPYATITDSAINYYVDTGVSSSTSYYYKIRITDSDGDISGFSYEVNDYVDGQGGTDNTPPIISNASSSEIQANWAKITWTTDEHSNSKVDYGTVSGSYTASSSVATIVAPGDLHTVYLNGLTPNTVYYYKIKSTDIANNLGQSAEYSFTTANGPVISGVSCFNVTDNSTTIIWNTDKATNSSQIIYSIYPNLSSPSTVAVSSVATSTGGFFQHNVVLTGLSQSTKYYYKVVSVDTNSNSTTDNDSGNYYSCSTTKDTKPPVISNISTPIITSGAVVVMWETDEPSTSQIEYGLLSASSGNYATTTVRDNTLTRIHAATVSGLNAETKYYYRVKSYDMNPDSATAVSEEQNVTTTATKDTIIVSIISGGGGGEAQDTTGPLISDIKVSDIGAFSAIISFTANEIATAFIEYGEADKYDLISGSSNFITNHAVKLSGLKMGTEYHLKIKAIDKAGNFNYSNDVSFVTEYFAESLRDLVTLERAANFQEAVENAIESILPNILPPFIEEPRVLSITENSAIVKWKTNVPAYSTVSYAPEKDYDVSKINSYIAESSQIEKKIYNHEINLVGLSANTKYHYMVKSFALPQAVGKSGDMTFATLAPKIAPRIIDIDNDAITIIWSTDEPSTSVVEYKNLRTGEINRKVREEKITSHNIKIENLMPDTSYEIKVFGVSEAGASVEAGEPILAKTSKDTAPPQISNLKIDGALVPGRNDRVQMVIFWRTDEPATSIVEYEEGSAKGEILANKIATTDTFVQNHTIFITNFKPGSLYQIRVTSVDDAGNKTVSPIRTIITPRQAESIIDVVVKNFEDTFQFLRKLK